MNFDLNAHTIFMTRSGSHAYGTNIEGSDEDYRGVCIPPLRYHFGFVNQFEQQVQNEPVDKTVFALKKFAQLAADCNPNIIEVLFTDSSDYVVTTCWGDELIANREMFLSKKARHTFSGYAYSQLKRIKTHRNWLLNPPKEPPTRLQHGLPENTKITKTDLGLIQALSDEQLKELSDEAQHYYYLERSYQNQLREWNQYQDWKKNRNPKRAELEARFGLDTKHALHLIRLQRMCKEILNGQSVIVKRPDAEELLSIRRGAWSYDKLIEESERLDAECEEAYKTSTLPHGADRVAIDNLVVNLTKHFLQTKGEI